MSSPSASATCPWSTPWSRGAIAGSAIGIYPVQVLRVGSSHWHIKHAFEAARQGVGLDDGRLRGAQHRGLALVRDAGPAGGHAGGRTGPPHPKKESGNAQPVDLQVVARPGCSLSLRVPIGIGMVPLATVPPDRWLRAVTVAGNGSNGNKHNCSL